jgi:RNA polymerase sigma-70 factor, ECF subfamily
VAIALARNPDRDDDGLHALYTTVAGDIFRYAYRLTGNRHDAEDLVQQAFLKLLERIRRRPLDLSRPVSPYLIAIVRNLHLDAVRRDRRTLAVAHVPEPNAPVAVEDDPERSLLHREQRRELNDALATLSDSEREVLALCDLTQSHAEVGALIGVKENAVSQRLFRARRKLARRLGLGPTLAAEAGDDALADVVAHICVPGANERRQGRAWMRVTGVTPLRAVAGAAALVAAAAAIALRRRDPSSGARTARPSGRR